MKDFILKLKEAGILLEVKNGRLQVHVTHDGEIGDVILAEISDRKQKLIEFLSGGDKFYAEILPVPLQPDYPVSNAQRRLWILNKIEQVSGIYNVFMKLQLKGSYNIPVFFNSINEVIKRHESLRTVFFENEDGDVRQRVLSFDELGFTMSHDKVYDRDNPQRYISDYIDHDRVKGFDLTRGPLIRAILFELNENDYVFYYNLHHIISDGWSTEILFRDVTAYYEALLKNQEPQLPDLQIQYKDYAVWQLNELEKNAATEHHEYWNNKLSGSLPVLTLPFSKARPRLKTYNGIGLNTFIDKKTTLGLKEISKNQGGSLFMLLLAGLNVLMYKYSNQRDIIIGSPMAGREIADLKDQIGFYVNILSLRNTVDPEITFIEFFNNLKESTTEAYVHQSYPFDRIVEDLNVRREIDRSPIFDISLTYHNISEVQKSNFIESPDEIISTGTSFSKYDIEFHFGESQDELSFSLAYNSDLFAEKDIRKLMVHFKQLLRQIAEEPEIVIGRIDYLEERERNQILNEFNKILPSDSYSNGITFIELFKEQVAGNPDNIAISDGEVQLTYQQLDRLSDEIALTLTGRFQIQPGMPVGLKLERGHWFIVSAIGVMKAGGAYVPISTEEPAEREKHIVETARIKVLITTSEKIFQLNQFDGELFAVDVEIEESTLAQEQVSYPLNVNSLAYIMFTSGTSGIPKGVEVEHGAFANLIAWYKRAYSLSHNSKSTLFSSVSFDALGFEIFPTLATGGRLFPISDSDRLNFDKLVDTINRNGITHVFLPTALYSSFHTKSSLIEKDIVLAVGGDALVVGDKNPKLKLYNNYGPTENTVVATWCMIAEDDNGAVPIGFPLDHVQIYILDESGNLCPIGFSGEIYIGGNQLARGYANDPKLTQEKFIPNHITGAGRLYKTGDLGKWLPDGRVQFMGRKDNQVKVRGYRIELGEIESAFVKVNCFNEFVVTIKTNASRENELVVYYVEIGEKINISDVRNRLRDILPEYMIPAHFISIDTLPLTTNGKVDKNQLPDISKIQVNETMDSETPCLPLEEELVKIFAQVLERTKESVGVADNFFDLGANSLKLLRIQGQVQQELGLNLDTIDLFTYPTIRSLVSNKFNQVVLNKQQAAPEKNLVKQSYQNGDIAIVGISGRFGKSKDIHDFWQQLVEEKELFSFYPEEELLKAGIDLNTEKYKGFVALDAMVLDADNFDYQFFGYSYEEALMMDPQIRIFHELTWQALEDANCLAEKEAVGMYITANDNLVWKAHTMLNPDPNVNPFFLAELSDSNFTGSLISYNLNLKGPSVYLDTACSSSLVAVHYACRALLANECSVAVSGGVRIDSTETFGYMHQEGMIGAKDGHCRTFDANSTGTIPGSGAGIVVLKRLEDAQKDGDHIYAVIKSSIINNDGKDKVGYTAPSISGQSDCISRAIELAKIPVETISYVEAHGTGTKLGDPIEVGSLNKAFGKKANHACGIGSVKTNIGHLGSAAGVAGLIKTALAIHNRTIPASLHFQSPNPEIKFSEGPFKVIHRTQKWEPEQSALLRAGVSSFGIGGTNAHAILEESVQVSNSGPSRPLQVITISAKTVDSLNGYRLKLGEYLGRTDTNLADAAYTLNNFRKTFEYRKTFIFENKDELLHKLLQPIEFSALHASSQSKKVVFLFPGQGSQYSGMAEELYCGESVFRSWVDQGLQFIRNKNGEDYSGILGWGSDKSDAINQTCYTQPILYIFEYALAQQLKFWGIEPDYLMGHSLGEYVAAAVAGVFSFELGLDLVLLRAKLMNQTLPGAMVAVNESAEKVCGLILPNLSIAAVNAKDLCVVSGNNVEIAQFELSLTCDNIEFSRLKTSHAFHSEQMDGILPEFAKRLSQESFDVPKYPIISNLTGELVSSEEMKSPTYWINQLRNAVQFEKGIETITSHANAPVFIEVGPGNTLSSFLRRRGAIDRSDIIQLLRHPKEDQNDYRVLLQGLASLYQKGVDIDWSRFYAHENRHKVSMPSYYFDRFRFPVRVSPISQEMIESYAAGGVKLDSNNWFYAYKWKRSEIPQHINSNGKMDAVIVFSHENDVSAKLVTELRKQGTVVVEVLRGESFKEIDDNHIQIDPFSVNDLDSLINLLNGKKLIIGEIILGLSIDLVERQEEIIKSTLPLLGLLQKLILLKPEQDKRIVYLSRDSQDVLGYEKEDLTVAAHAMLIRIFVQETVQFSYLHFDYDAKTPVEKLVSGLMSELSSDKQNQVAVRNGVRWVQFIDKLDVKTPETNSKIRESALYLITGGLGNLGLTMVNYLVIKKRANVVLLGRNKLGDQNDLALLDCAGIQNQQAANKLKTMQDLLQEEGRVFYYSCDVGSLRSLKETVQRIEQNHGQISGFIHAAGNQSPDTFKAVEYLDADALFEQLRSKFSGTQNLIQLFKNRNLDFAWFTGSLSTVLGGLTFGAYAIANKLMEILVKENQPSGWVCSNLDGITDAKIDPKNLVKVFEKSLQLVNSGGLIVSTKNLLLQVPDWQEKNAVTARENIRVTQRPLPNSSYVIYRSDLEADICKMWQDFFQIETIGIEDDFFELGGDSLQAMTILKRIKTEHGIVLNLSRFYANPTIRYISDSRLTNSASHQSVPITSRKVRIYGFPTHIGMAIDFKKITNILGNDYELIMLHSSGIEEGETLHKSFRGEAMAFAKTIVSDVGDDQIVLLGFSFGVYPGFETAKELEKLGKFNYGLVLIDQASEVQKWMQNRPDFDVNKSIMERARKYFGESEIGRIENVVYNNFNMVINYEIEGVLTVDIHCLEGNQNDRVRNMETWAKHTSGELRHVYVDSDHDHMLDYEHHKALRELIDRAAKVN